jgi:hypothetical protein
VSGYLATLPGDDPAEAFKATTPVRQFACPRCGSPEHIVARRSITYDAYQDVKVEFNRETGKPVVTNVRDAELQDVEAVTTVWFLCESEECQRVRGDNTFQIDDFVQFPHPIDLCAKCDHLYEHHLEDDETGERVCHECGGCEDFTPRGLHPEQMSLAEAA